MLVTKILHVKVSTSASSRGYLGHSKFEFIQLYLLGKKYMFVYSDPNVHILQSIMHTWQ